MLMMRVTLPSKTSPTSGSRVMPRIMALACSRPSAFAPVMRTVPSSSSSMFVPVWLWIERIILPPGPMTSRILSGWILIVSMRGAQNDSSGRGALMTSCIAFRMKRRASRACANASRMIASEMPLILMSICRAVMPLAEPQTLKSISP